jgi:hypothetical protein
VSYQSPYNTPKDLNTSAIADHAGLLLLPMYPVSW